MRDILGEGSNKSNQDSSKGELAMISYYGYHVLYT